MGMKYLIKLKYIKPVQLAVNREQKLAEFYPIFEDGTLGKVEAKARVFLPEYSDFAKGLGFEVKKRRMTTENDYAYLRAMIYGVVMGVLRNPGDWERLEERVLEMEPIELRYWASKFRNVYWKYKNMRRLMFLARRFMEVEMI
ncbi:hypothetical protein [Pyrococcus horikoshii]|uniref:Uncharacterized protein n=2 Tax=Pyrococcus horikoshii TaxID=53953 RepID=O58632_PYRHO|nr:hypothetical protein [Pyrococcus horikoshii]BAA29995.1 142aa long hypothetical protein [Pyrococcus horikoshii OT3]HII61244.1 hypothetical protein [Pyrococcus horikoshii]